MPEVKEEVPATSVFGQPRTGVARHTFVGGNFFMQRILNKFRSDLAVKALPQEMDAAVNRTLSHLQNDAATISLQGGDVRDGRLDVDVTISNLGGHKLPTAYPSRRAWLHLSVRDAKGQTVFESGALRADGAVQGNDNDEDGTRIEPHYTTITRPEIGRAHV